MVASVLVFMRGGAEGPGPGPCHALAEGRRVATEAGATLHAATLVGGSADGEPDDAAHEWLRALGQAGADKVVIARHPAFARPPIWSTHGDALTAIARQISPLLILFPAGPNADELAPRVAAALRGPFLADATIEVGDQGEVGIVRTLSEGRTQRLSVSDLGRPVVATLPERPSAAARGDDDADLVLFPVEPPDDNSVTLVDSSPSPVGALEGADVIVSAGAGVATADNFALCEQLADALGGQVATTLPAHRRGLGRLDQVVDISRAHVSPRLYIACGSSGSRAHLAGVSQSSTIVAINRDASARIFQRATYGVVGDVAEVLPELIAQARQRRRGSP